MRIKPFRVDMKYIHIPIYLYILHKFVILTVYVVFMNGLDFMNTLSRKKVMPTYEHISTQKDVQISSSLTKIIIIYARAGFRVITVLMGV